MSKPELGFSLIEVLISIAVGALLLASLSQILITVREGWERSTASDEALGVETLAHEAIIRTLKAGIAAGPYQQEGGLRGTDTGLEMIVMPPQSAVALGRLKARLTTERQADGTINLVLSVKPLTSSSGTTPALLRERWILLQGLESVRFEYSGPLDKQPKNHWEELAVAPELVELYGVYKSPDTPPFWIAVRPRSVVPGECVLDWTSLTCRTS